MSHRAFNKSIDDDRGADGPGFHSTLLRTQHLHRVGIHFTFLGSINNTTLYQYANPYQQM